jgi:hypothetical protein
MAHTLSDTSPEADAVLVEQLRKMPVWQRWEQVNRLNMTLRTLALSDLRRLHPQATEAELHRYLADRLLGPELALKVYGPLPGTGSGDE